MVISYGNGRFSTLGIARILIRGCGVGPPKPETFDPLPSPAVKKSYTEAAPASDTPSLYPATQAHHEPTVSAPNWWASHNPPKRTTPATELSGFKHRRDTGPIEVTRALVAVASLPMTLSDNLKRVAFLRITIYFSSRASEEQDKLFHEALLLGATRNHRRYFGPRGLVFQMVMIHRRKQIPASQENQRRRGTSITRLRRQARVLK
ncbi:hypothetical protein VTL71DRAFT_3895 [Oculimacula yallundae]|uniref:Uncharacterized protein n=1 Tax=Oculimacula yallundae TaxID=86028 RepID=A0ABR4C5Z8_9HELO